MVEGFLAFKEPDKELQMDEYGSSPIPTDQKLDCLPFKSHLHPCHK